MKEQAWLKEVDAHELFQLAADRVSNRKLRLFTCACARHVVHFIRLAEAAEIVDAAEGHAADTGDENWQRAYEGLLHNRLLPTDADFYLARILESTLDIRSYSAALTALDYLILFESEVYGHPDDAFQLALVRDIFGNPFRPIDFTAWRTDTALTLAGQMYESRDFGAMPILADALQDAGCNNDDVLNHCRDANQTHYRGCWVVDGVLGLE
jgi:hypothetical protein